MKIGVLGAGQLARMLALAGLPHAHEFVLFDPEGDACGARVAPRRHASYTDTVALQQFAKGLDVVTCEFENVPVSALETLAQELPVFPPPRAFALAQDRVLEKTFLNSLGIATAPFAAVETLPELEAAAAAFGLPAVLKTRRFGYDGRGQFVIRSPQEIPTAFQALGGKNLILEGFVPFARELSVIGVRARDGEKRFYPLCDNTHTRGILSLTRAPAAVAAEVTAAAVEASAKVLDALAYVGVLVMELFLAADGETLIANEFAPRVHNSGHWTIEGAATSQFENHLRAVAGLPLGATDARRPAAMLNLVGQLPSLASLLTLDDAHAHFYGKIPKPGRKLGHLTLLAESEEQLTDKITAAQILCKWSLAD